MTEAPFSNREIKLMFKTAEDKIEEVFTEVKAIRVKVGWLERMVWVAIGGVCVLTFFMGLDRIDLAQGDDAELENAIEAAVAQSFETYLELEGYTDLP